tara:strand:- start:30354 stop:30836 length:483 start_codon:yes stop_codon:yes gene_type:complete
MDNVLYICAIIKKKTMGNSHKLTLEQSKKFILAGNSTFTVVSKDTQARYTYKIKTNRTGDVLFVSYLNGSENTSDYKFLGTIFKNNAIPFKYFHSRKKTDPKSIVNRTFEWVYDTIQNQKQVNFDKIELWHEGKCGRCGRKLTVPESIESGFGSVCSKKS